MGMDYLVNAFKEMVGMQTETVSARMQQRLLRKENGSKEDGLKENEDDISMVSSSSSISSSATTIKRKRKKSSKVGKKKGKVQSFLDNMMEESINKIRHWNLPDAAEIDTFDELNLIRTVSQESNSSSITEVEKPNQRNMSITAATNIRKAASKFAGQVSKRIKAGSTRKTSIIVPPSYLVTEDESSRPQSTVGELPMKNLPERMKVPQSQAPFTSSPRPKRTSLYEQSLPGAPMEESIREENLSQNISSIENAQNATPRERRISVGGRKAGKGAMKYRRVSVSQAPSFNPPNTTNQRQQRQSLHKQENTALKTEIIAPKKSRRLSQIQRTSQEAAAKQNEQINSMFTRQAIHIEESKFKFEQDRLRNKQRVEQLRKRVQTPQSPSKPNTLTKSFEGSELAKAMSREEADNMMREQEDFLRMICHSKRKHERKVEKQLEEKKKRRAQKK